jgi:hypothetical protein
VSPSSNRHARVAAPVATMGVSNSNHARPPLRPAVANAPNTEGIVQPLTFQRDSRYGAQLSPSLAAIATLSQQCRIRDVGGCLLPRTGSRAQLIHILAKDLARTHTACFGDYHPPALFYEEFARRKTQDLVDLAKEIGGPSRRGRPRRSLSKVPIGEIDALRSSKSERSAIRIVASRLRIKESALRKRYRDAKKRSRSES